MVFREIIPPLTPHSQRTAGYGGAGRARAAEAAPAVDLEAQPSPAALWDPSKVKIGGPREAQPTEVPGKGTVVRHKMAGSMNTCGA